MSDGRVMPAIKNEYNHDVTLKIDFSSLLASLTQERCGEIGAVQLPPLVDQFHRAELREVSGSTGSKATAGRGPCSCMESMPTLNSLG